MHLLVAAPVKLMMMVRVWNSLGRKRSRSVKSLPDVALAVGSKMNHPSPDAAAIEPRSDRAATPRKRKCQSPTSNPGVRRSLLSVNKPSGNPCLHQ